MTHAGHSRMPTYKSSSRDIKQHPASILIVRVSAIGDVLMASPVAQALREAYPDAHIAWVVEPLSAPLVRANPYVDEVIVVETSRRWVDYLHKKQLLPLWREVRSFARDLRARRFDLVLDIHGLLKTGLICSFTRAPRRIGPAKTRECNHWFMTEVTPRHPNPTRLADLPLSLLAPLGIPLTPRRPVLRIPEADRDAARAFLAADGITVERYIACCISSSWPQKDWLWERWAELAELLWERDGLRCVLIGGPERRAEAERIVARSASPLVSAVARTSLLESAALIHDALGVIGVDTGLTYAGMAADVPTVALYGPTCHAWLRNEPRTTVVTHATPCTPCFRHPSCRHFDCMQAITAEEAATALRKLLSGLLVNA